MYIIFGHLHDTQNMGGNNHKPILFYFFSIPCGLARERFRNSSSSFLLMSALDW